MKKTFLLVILLAVGFAAVSAQQWEEFDLFGGEMYGEKTGSTLNVQYDGTALVFSGTTNEKGAGYVIESLNLGIDVNKRIMLEISGIRNTDNFDHGKLFKFVLNNNYVSTQNSRDMNRNDPQFLNARDGIYIFEISNMRGILKINIVFYNSTIQNLKVKMYTER